MNWANQASVLAKRRFCSSSIRGSSLRILSLTECRLIWSEAKMSFGLSGVLPTRHSGWSFRNRQVMILPYDANLSRMEFSERTREFWRRNREFRIGPREPSRQDSSASDDAREDDAACTAELICKFAQVQWLLAEAQAIELHQLGLVEIDRDARPECVEIIRLPAGRHSDRHDRIHR